MPKKLSYFNLNGLAEPIRYILHYTNQEFEDVRYDVYSWPDPKIKASLPYGQFPVYEEDGRVLTQSLAITKYVARGTDLVPTDPWDNAFIESVVFSIMDYWKNVVPTVREPDPAKYTELRNEIIEKNIPYYFSRFNKHLEDNGGFLNGKLSWGDFVFCGVIEASDMFLGIELSKDYPAVGTLVQHIRNLPGVKEYVKAIGPYTIDLARFKYKK
ncbi:glutathione S-transferase-like [Spodoptera litura]|uniref:glutathione transferase n=1 Tax=Spodoptera litura TaxID=69820 RepID=A0A9J7IS80_SPOLT|nr:glutathione S-transferase-like [Spodoptera litura]